MIDEPTCCLPSIHCLSCFYIILALLKSKTNKYFKITNVIVCILIVFSTLFIKQHVILDVLASLIITIISYILVFRFKLNPIKKIIKL